MFVPVIEIDVPALPEDMVARDHNRFVKEALKETLQLHFRRNIRKHFQHGNRSRYSHRPRSNAWRKRKQRQKGHDIDLLFSGESRDKIARSAIKIRVGGAAVGGKKGISARYSLRFPFKGAAEMARELERWSADEVRAANKEFHTRYMRKVKEKRSRRKRLRSKK